MGRFILTAVITGLLFAFMDGLINGNPYAVKLMDVYKPIANQSMNISIGLTIDLFYGFIISFIFKVIRPALPTNTRITKGLLYGLGIWFFRVVMGVISNWLMFNIPTNTLIYILLAGLVEMLVLGMINGLMLKK